MKRAFAIINNQGYWCGIWNDRATAEAVLAKGQPSHGERIVELVEASKAPDFLSEALNSGDGSYRP